MYARLWWKDFRQFWPIWLVVLLAAGATQGLILTLAGEAWRHGTLVIAALLFAGLYALAVGAAAFAGEREAGTLPLLDDLAADRRVVWSAKCSFALLSTLILTASLVVMAALGTVEWDLRNPVMALDAAGGVVLVVIALGWALFWSSLLRTALAAALAAMACLWLTLVCLAWDNGLELRGRSSFTGSAGLAQFVVIIATVAASDLFFTGAMRIRGMNLRFQSPIVFTRSGSRRPRRVAIQAPVAAVPAVGPLPITAVRQPRARTAAHSGRRSRAVETWMLFRQTIKEGRKTWSLLVAIGVGIPALLALRFNVGQLDSEWLWIVGLVVSLAGGTSVFGHENRARTYRFLVNQGARPGSVWLVKVMTWALGVAMIVVPLAWIFYVGVERRDRVMMAIVYWSPLAFAVGVICGMMFRRGITAFVIAIVLTLALLPPLVTLWTVAMLPPSGFLVVAAALLMVSWAWRSDWMLERPAPGRWLRLGLFALTALALVSAVYIPFRAWSVPDIGPIAPPSAWAASASILANTEENAAPLYSEAGRSLIYRDDAREFLIDNKVALDLVRRAAARPHCVFNRPEKASLLDGIDVPAPWEFSRLVNQAAQDRLEHGDLAGSWDDIMVLFRMTRHFVEGSGLDLAYQALGRFERDALALALDWAVAPGQTPERLHAAMEAYRDLPKIAPPSDVVRAQANINENTLNLPANKLRMYVEDFALGNPSSRRKDRLTAVIEYAGIALVTTPWELSRARRENRLSSAEDLEVASREPGHRIGDYWNEPAHGRNRFQRRSSRRQTPMLQLVSRPATDYLFTDDQNEVARRALVQILAIRSWQLKHDGRFPDRLDALVPDELPSLPSDPYSDGPFGCVHWSLGMVFPLRIALAGSWMGSDRPLISPNPQWWLLYSVGPDRRDDGGVSSRASDKVLLFGDIVFAIPPVGKAPAEGKRNADTTPVKPRSEAAKPK